MAINRRVFISLLECIKHYTYYEQRSCRPTAFSTPSLFNEWEKMNESAQEIFVFIVKMSLINDHADVASLARGLKFGLSIVCVCEQRTLCRVYAYTKTRLSIRCLLIRQVMEFRTRRCMTPIKITVTYFIYRTGF